MTNSINKQATKTEDHGLPISQEKKGFRQNWSAWMKQLPQLKFPKINDTFRIIRQEKDLSEKEKEDPNFKTLEDVITEARADKNMMAPYTKNEAAIAAAQKRLEEDLEWLEEELEPLFRTRDHEASSEQNRYRIYQLGFMVLAAIATFIGSLQALTFADNPKAATAFAFGETVVALYAAYLASLSGRRPPLPKWLGSRQRAEYLRREYFYFLMNLAPYNDPKWDAPERKRQLAQRATNINQGNFPEIAQGGV